MRRIRIHHTTAYRYTHPVGLQPHRLLVRPREGHDLRIEASKLEITPSHTIRWQRDAYDNSVAIVTFQEPADMLAVVSEVIVQLYDDAPLDFVVTQEAMHFPFHYDPAERLDLIPYVTSVFPEDGLAVRDWLG